MDLSDTEMANVITGISSLDLVESAAYSESMMGSQAYSLVVVKVKNKKNTEAIANEMLNGINQSKWICVTADDLRVAAAGDVAVLIMVDSGFKDTVTAKEIVNAFKSPPSFSRLLMMAKALRWAVPLKVTCSQKCANPS